jgi:hypothetical protein
MGFEIGLEGERLVLFRKSAAPDQRPRLVFRGMRRAPGVVIGKALLEVGGSPDIFLIRKSDAADDVDVPHRITLVARQ